MPLIAHYKLNGEAADAGGYGHDGTPTDVSFVAGQIAQAGNFNGSTSLIDCNSDFLGTGPLTISVWLKPGSYGEGGYSRIIENERLRFYMRQPSTAYAFQSDAGLLALSAAGSVAMNVWQHLAVVRDSSDLVNFYINFYINGVLSGAPDQNTGTPLAGTTNAIVGNNAAGSRTFDGLMDDVRIYNEALPEWKIRTIYNYGKGSEECEPWQRLIRPAVQPTVRPLIGA